MFILADKVVTQLEVKDTGQILGYGFECASTVAGTGPRLQRWLMFGTVETIKSWNDATLKLRPALDSEWAHADTAFKFVDKAKKAFLLGRDTYVVANCHSIQGDTIDLTRFPALQFYPTRPAGEFQMDFRVANIFRKPPGAPAELVGIVNARRDSDTTRVEYWALFERYALPDGTDDVRVEPIQDLGFEAFVRLIDGTTWTPQCRLVRAACAYFDRGPTDSGDAPEGP